LLSALEDQLERAVTDAFSRPFLLAALLSLLALVPLSLGRARATLKRATPVLAATGAAGALLAAYLALGGASYEPTPVADPCVAREWRDPGGLQAVFEQIVLSALDGAACELEVSREELVLAVRDEEALDAFAEQQGLARADAERAVTTGLERAVDDAEEAGALPGPLAGLARRAVEAVSPWLLLEALESLGGLLP
jgi:hypothetical protein